MHSKTGSLVLVLGLSFGVSFAHATETENQQVAADSIRAYIQSAREEVCQKLPTREVWASNYLDCHWDYSTALDLVDNIELLAQKQRTATPEQLAKIQKDINYDFEMIDKILDNLRKKYGK